MTKKDIQKFDKMVQKTFKGKKETFDEIIKICTNMMVQENEVVNLQLMNDIENNCSRNQADNYLDEYFSISNIIVKKLEQLENLSSEEQFKQALKGFAKNILLPVPLNLQQEKLIFAIEYLINVVVTEYNLSSMASDMDEQSTRKELEERFLGITQFSDLFLILFAILDDLKKNKRERVQIVEYSEMMVTFIVFGNLVRKKAFKEEGFEQQNIQSTNSTNYNPSSEKILQLKISIKGAKPPIWRRVLVQNDTTFEELHFIIQDIFNWEGDHLHLFNGINSYCDVELLEDSFGHGNQTFDESEYLISSELQNEKDKLRYIYDFGDDWVHEVLLEKMLEVDEKKEYPACIKGKRNGPLEDCGGMWGYRQITYAINNNDYEGLEFYFDEDGEFFYEDFDPEFFDIDEINRRLR